jgi:small subunit ribosomal protein S6
MSIHRQYELVYIASPDATEEDLAELHSQVATVVERFSGTIVNTENWGRRRLAYEINRHREGVYILELIDGPADMTTELDRRLRVLDGIMRHLIIRVDEDQAKDERSRTRRKDATVARRLRRGLPAEPTEQELSRRKANMDDNDGGNDSYGEGDR